MRIKQIILLIIMVLVYNTCQAGSITENQFSSIKLLGQLNGVALHCKYLGETRKMKQALVSALPKRRQLGKAFDDITNESFLAFIQNKSACPEKEQFTTDVDTAIQRLNAAFSE